MLGLGEMMTGMTVEDVIGSVSELQYCTADRDFEDEEQFEAHLALAYVRLAMLVNSEGIPKLANQAS